MSSSVLLRAKLITTYPRGVIATLTGLIDGRLPVTGKAARVEHPRRQLLQHAAKPPPARARPPAPRRPPLPPPAPATPGTTAPPSPTAAAAAAPRSGHPLAARGPHDLPQGQRRGGPGRPRDAARQRRASSACTCVLRDVYGDVFTYAGLGQHRPDLHHRRRRPPGPRARRSPPPPAQAPAPKGPPAPAPSRVTLKVNAPKPASPGSSANSGKATIAPVAAAGVPAGMGRARLYAHPGNPDARRGRRRQGRRAGARDALAQPASRCARARSSRAGTVLGTGHRHPGRQRRAPALRDPAGRRLGHDRPRAGALQLGPAAGRAAPRGREGVERAARRDRQRRVPALALRSCSARCSRTPKSTIYGCGRRDIASGLVDKRVLAVIAFLARSGLEPTVSALRCGQSAVHAPTARCRRPTRATRSTSRRSTACTIAHHQGPGTITDLTIRTLLTLPQRVRAARNPQPDALPGLLAARRPPRRTGTRSSSSSRPPQPPTAAGAGTAAHARRRGRRRRRQPVGHHGGALSTSQWDALMGRIGGAPVPDGADQAELLGDPRPRAPSRAPRRAAAGRRLRSCAGELRRASTSAAPRSRRSIVDEDNTVLGSARRPTPTEGGPPDVAREMAHGAARRGQGGRDRARPAGRGRRRLARHGARGRRHERPQPARLGGHASRSAATLERALGCAGGARQRRAGRDDRRVRARRRAAVQLAARASSGAPASAAG